MKLPRLTGKRINTLLLVLILVVNAYTIFLPFIPKLLYAKKINDSKATAGLPYVTKQQTGQSTIVRKPIPDDQRLVIPSIALDEHIFEGKDPNLVHRGVWARPLTSNPLKGSNTVLVGHRFTYNGASVFYNLDKVKVGDKISVYWQKTEFVYTVTQTRVVTATETSVESPSVEPQLTLYTCTPLWSAKDRLVIIAKLDGGTN